MYFKIVKKTLIIKHKRILLPTLKNMYRIRLWPLGIAVIALIFGSCNVEKRSDAEQVAKAMLDRMTLEEKVGQMAQITLDVVGKGDSLFNSYEPFELDTAELREAIVDYHVGSVLNSSNNRARSLAAWNSIVSTIQNVAIAKTRLAIPVLYGIDAVHGANYTAEATLFPQQIGMAATWNDSLVQAIGSITAYETRASGIPWVFSPVLDLGADPRFPRQYEGFGEDPHLCSVLGVALVNGYQGASVSSPLKVAACAKHYLGYSAPSSGKDRTPAQLPNITLKEYHLPPFKAAVEAGVKTFMVNSGVINGLPVHASHYIITELLKEELGFEGVVVSDWNDIENLYRRDRVVATEKEAIGLAVNAGIDMAMIPYRYQDFCNQLVELVREGSVEESRIDDAVMRILKLKAELGLFERPTTVLGDYPKAGSEEFAKVSYQAAGESITLLKNSNGILPLSKDKRYKILVAGPNANSMRTLDGGWSYSWQGEKVEEFAGRYNTIFEAIKSKVPQSEVSYIPGVSYPAYGRYFEEQYDKFEESAAAARKADVIILCLGENSYAEKPGDLNDLYLGSKQLNLAEELAKTGKPIILVLNEGRPRVISPIEPMMAAVVQTYLPGSYGADALADILFGDINPSGRLPYTYPSYPNSTVVYYHKPAEEQKPNIGAYSYESDYNPQYPFGYGLSYTNFEYSQLTVNRSELKQNDTLTISVNVRNTGDRKGKDVVQLYTSDLVATITPDVKRLRKFAKIELAPGEAKTLTFKLVTSELAFVDSNDRLVVEPGEFIVSVGNLSTKFHIVN